MSTTTNNFHEFLSNNSYNLEKIRDFLERDNLSINEQNSEGKTALQKVLMSSKCSIDVVRLLLQYGADVNITDNWKYSALHTALEYSREEEIIAALLEKGANIDNRDCLGRTPLCSIFMYRHWKRSSPKPEWKENVLNLLLQAGLDLNKVDASRRSPLCHVLWEGWAGVRDIELLLSKGGSLNACQEHATPLHCITDGWSGGLLKASVVQLLLDKHRAREGEVFDIWLEPLQNALKYCLHEPAVIKLLLEHSDANAVDTWIRQASNVLHFVVQNPLHNPNCKTSILKLFLKRGASIHKLNERGETVLHSALDNDSHNVSVTNFLLKIGANVNFSYMTFSKYAKTALSIAIKREMRNDVISSLLAFGAKFSISGDENEGYSLLEEFMYRFKQTEEKRCVFETLVKYYYLEFPNFDIQRLIRGYCDYEIRLVLAAKCKEELQRMETKNVRSDCTLRRFITENFLLNIKTDQEIKGAYDDCYQLLKILSSNEFPEYFDVIASKMLASKVGEEFLKKNLQELVVFTVNQCHVNPSLIKKVVLNNDCVRKLALFLSEDELLRMIVAFYHVDNPTYNSKTSKKRDLDAEQFTKVEKRTKLL